MSDAAPSIRLETWDDADGWRIHLLALSAGRDLAIAHVLARTEDGRSLWAGSGLFTDGCLACDRDALFRLVALVPANRTALDVLGAFDADPDRLAQRLILALGQIDRYEDPHPRASRRLARHLGACPVDPAASALGLYATQGVATDGVMDPWSGMPQEAPPADPASAPAIRLPGAFRLSTWAPAKEGPTLADILRPWHAGVRGTALPGPLAALGMNAWSEAAYAHHSEPGDIGLRRAQAALLQPAFAPLLARDPHLAALVDAGRPFEIALLLKVREAMPEIADGLTQSKLRRMRHMGRTPVLEGADGLRNALACAAAFPIEKVPATSVAWANFRCQGASAFSRLTPQLDAHDLLRGIPADWDVAALLPESVREGRQAPAELIRLELNGVLDMAERLVDTLVKRAIPHRWARRNPANALAQRILFGGLTLLQAFEAQRRWHAGLRIFEASLAREEDLEWPALFEPHDTGNGIRIACLTTSAELRAEGGDGPDERGLAGLDHCVGGYALMCATGEVHVASVTGPGPDGARVRLSTAAFSIASGDVGLVQHYGARNGEPPPGAERAVRRLLLDLADGRVPMDRAAMRPRNLPPGTIARDDPGSVFEAWRPYLPRRVAEAGLAALVAAHPPEPRSEAA